MTKLIITRGIPGSGKTTWAKSWVAEDPEKRARVNRDDLRVNLFSRPAPLTHRQETAVTEAQVGAVTKLLAYGFNVVVDDTCVNIRRVREWFKIARSAGAEFEVNEEFRNVPLHSCIDRNDQRAKTGVRRVPKEVILDMHERLQNSPTWNSVIVRELGPELGTPLEETYKYVPTFGKPSAYIFDLDGTLAHMNARNPFDWTRVGEDSLDHSVATILRILTPHARIIILSGRDECSREATAIWLRDNWITYDELLMRPQGDFRKDSVVKLELFQKYIAEKFLVQGVFDDRNQVVDMWRSIGLKCLQVAPGDF